MKDKKTDFSNDINPVEHEEALAASQAEAEQLEGHQDAATDAPLVKDTPVIERLRNWSAAHKKHIILGVAGALLVAATTLVVTDAKYAALNVFAKANIKVTVVDESTNQPVPKATVAVNGVLAETSKDGSALLGGVPYGDIDIKVSKFAYGDKTASTKITESGQAVSVSLAPAGTPVSFTITNTITGRPIKGAKASFGNSDALSNEKGVVTLSIPPQRGDEIEVALSRDGMTTVQKKVSLKAAESTPVTLTPVGTVYFLSKRTGKIDVMKSNLDGSDPRVVVAGTGREDNYQTVLLASRDWKYLALKSKRDGGEKLFLIDTYNDNMTVIDEGKAAFSPVGWNGHTFIYRVHRESVEAWQAKREAIKSFNASSKRISIIDETEAEGDSAYSWKHQYFDSPYIINDGLVYVESWSSNVGTSEKERRIIFSRTDGSHKKVLKAVNNAEYGITAKLYAVDEIYYSVFSYQPYNPNTATYYEYENGVVKESKISHDRFNGYYATQLLSPTNKATLWSEPRDGKHTLLVGDSKGAQGKEIISLGDYVAYGWFSDEFILVAKSGSELFIMPKTGPTERGPLKITNYHKPDFDGRGYGYGYGGF